MSLPAAKTRYLEWAAEIQSRFASIRAARKGGGRALTKKQALGLAGEWYVWFVKRHEDAPGTPEHWQARWLALLDDLEEPAPPAVQASTDGGAIWEWLNSAEARPIVRPIIADEAQTAQFLASQGLVLSNEARDMFLDMVQEEFLEAVKLLERRANRDYKVDPRVQTFPKFELDKGASAADLTPWKLFEAWVEKRKPAPATITRWRCVFLDLDKHFAGRAAGSLKDDEAHAWATQLVTPKRKAATVADVWINAAHTVWTWAVEQRKVLTNPFAGVKVTVPKKTYTRDTKAFTAGEAQTILKASSAIGDPGKSSTELSIRETSILTTVSPRQVGYMRAVWKKRSADSEWKESIEGLPWRQVLRMEGLTKPTKEHEDWIETEAQKIVDALLKAKIGQGLMKNPDITARALAKINADLPKALIYEWGYEAPDAIREIADELARGPIEF